MTTSSYRAWHVWCADFVEVLDSSLAEREGAYSLAAEVQNPGGDASSLRSQSPASRRLLAARGRPLLAVAFGSCSARALRPGARCCKQHRPPAPLARHSRAGRHHRCLTSQCDASVALLLVRLIHSSGSQIRWVDAELRFAPPARYNLHELRLSTSADAAKPHSISASALTSWTLASPRKPARTFRSRRCARCAAA